MNPLELEQMPPGFQDLALGSQTVFRGALQALSLPGRVFELPHPAAQLPDRGHSAAALLLLALLDSDCTLWLSPSLADSQAQAWLRFHTGCRCVSAPGAARFLWFGAADPWPALAQLDWGSDEYPDQAATCVIELPSLHDIQTTPLQLSGPGIEDCVHLHARGLPADFAAQWAANHAAFPRGVDAFLVAGRCISGLPRSTRLHPPLPTPLEP
ncbi:MAG: phosphonate C-P lyase system protein PhnH [Betaproteobacteria bacterium]|nr:phosphonate C-P lyase system protein PhnH [Betaproteobacteria bacterium]